VGGCFFPLLYGIMYLSPKGWFFKENNERSDYIFFNPLLLSNSIGEGKKKHRVQFNIIKFELNSKWGMMIFIVVIHSL
jgi:hypothetical protein